MDMLASDPPEFLVSGMLGTQRMPSQVNEAWNYFYRAIHATTAAARGMGLHDTAEMLLDYMRSFELISANDHGRRPSRTSS